jgi:hypothetical protein
MARIVKAANNGTATTGLLTRLLITLTFPYRDKPLTSNFALPES